MHADDATKVTGREGWRRPIHGMTGLFGPVPVASVGLAALAVSPLRYRPISLAACANSRKGVLQQSLNAQLFNPLAGDLVAKGFEIRPPALVVPGESRRGGRRGDLGASRGRCDQIPLRRAQSMCGCGPSKVAVAKLMKIVERMR